MSDETIECPVCHKPWSKDCQQATIIAKHGSCAVCRYVEHVPEDMTQEKCEAELVEMFGPGNYFPKHDSHLPAIPKEGWPVGDFTYLAGPCDPGPHKSNLEGLREPRDGEVMVDTETPTARQREALASALKVVEVEPGVYHMGDGHLKRMDEIMRAMEMSGSKLLVVDSHAEREMTPAEIREKAFAACRTSDEVDRFIHQVRQPRQQYRRPGLATAALGMVAGITGLGMAGMFPSREERPMRKCALPECEVMHNHPGGYCKAEHCREHARRQKEARKVGK